MERISAPSAAVQKSHDAIAEKWLMRAAGTGAVVALAYELTGWGAVGYADEYPTLHLPGVRMWLRFVPPLLILGAWAMTARNEERLRIRGHRGALALLAGLSFLAIPANPMYGMALIYGVGLLLLAFRTRDVHTVICGVIALLAVPFTSTGGPFYLIALAAVAIFMFVAASAKARRNGARP